MPDIVACRLEELAEGAAKRIERDGGGALALVRCEGKVYALADSCPHKGGYLSEGQVSTARREVVCPWHRFRFKLESGESATNAELKARTFPARVDDQGRVVVTLP